MQPAASPDVHPDVERGTQQPSPTQSQSNATAPPFEHTPDTLTTLISHRDTTLLSNLGGPSSLATTLLTNPQSGLPSPQLRPDALHARTEFYGSNTFRYPPPKSFIALLGDAFRDLTIIILCVAAVVSLVIGVAVKEKRLEYAYLEGIAIVVVVAVVVFVQAVIDKHKDAKFRQLNSVKDQYTVQVRRDGKPVALTANHILVGDVVALSAGDKIPADCLVLSASGLKTNEAAMTGEPIDIEKSAAEGGDPFLLSGTSVSEGIATALVVAVGERSQWGVILKGLIVEPEDTPLQQRLDVLAWSIGKLGILFAVLTFLVSVARWVAMSARENSWDATHILEAFINAVTIVVVAIPEGLPLAITLGLAFAMRKMMRDNNYVRRLEACETMGSATQLNADKTGTLTQNRMTVVEAFWRGVMVNYEAEVVGEGNMSEAFRQAVCIGIAVNTQANLEVSDEGLVSHLGSKTECALLQLVRLWGRDYSEIRATWVPFRVYMFDSVKKCMSTAVVVDDGVVRLFTKGAPEILLPKCVGELAEDGEGFVEMTEERRGEIARAVNDMAGRGLRTLLLAVRDVRHSVDDEGFWKNAPEGELTFVGVVGIKDPIRAETKEAVRQLKQAGVTVRMVTGDNALTARFIAKEAGILDEEGIVMEGPTFRGLSDGELEECALKIQVLARSTPHDKLVLVRKLKELGEVTSVTGDGTNDGPALKEADVGFALGIAGTEVAKEACDIVILDDNIKSMTKAVLWGRNVYESIRKFLQFQLIVNVVAVTLNFISACAGEELPLGAVPLLWVNMIMDSMGALALATEPPRDELLERKPYGRRAPLINREMYRNIIGVSVYQLVVSLVLQFRGRDIFNLCEVGGEMSEKVRAQCDLDLRSIIFNVFVFMQIGSEINSRRIGQKNVFSGILSSVWFLCIIGITVVIQVALMVGVGNTKVGRSVGIGSVDGPAWGAAIVLGLLVLPWGFLVRFIPLDWCYGPTDEDPTQMSKLERLLHLPKRKMSIVAAEDDGDAPKDGELQAVVHGSNEDGRNGDAAGGGAGAASMKKEDDAGVYTVFDDQESSVGTPRAPRVSRARMRLRVFVHAVAFVNVVSRGKITSQQAKSADSAWSSSS